MDIGKVTLYMKLKSNINLKWEKQTVDGYLIYRLTNSGWNEIVRIENTEITSIWVSDVNIGGEVVFKIVYFVYDKIRRIRKIKEKKVYAQIDKNGRTFIYNIARPQLQSVKKINNGIKLKWLGASPRDEKVKYRIFRKKKGESWKKIADVKGLQFLDDTVLLGETYTYTVRCISDDEKQYLSNFDTIGLEILYI